MNGGDGSNPQLSAFRNWIAEQPATAGYAGTAAIAEGVVAGTSKKTWIFPGRRERGVAILRGADPERLHESRPFRVVPPGESPAIRSLAAVGVALAGEPALVVLGTGSTSYGTFHEAIHLAALHDAPITFVVVWYLGQGPFGPQMAVSPMDLATSVGMAAARADGKNAEAVRAAVASLAGGAGLVQVELLGNV